VKTRKMTDVDGNGFRVQRSSDVRPCVWIFTDQVTGQHMGRDTHAALHLNPRKARALAQALLRFADAAGGEG